MSRLWLALLCLLATTPGFAQTASVERIVAGIRAQYDEIGQRIRQSEARKPDEVYGIGIVRSELAVNKDGEPWRAVGIYRIVYTFWFHEALDPEPNFPKRLRKATVASRIAARKYYQEFFYDQNGTLVFYFRRAEEGEKPAELRLYFDKGRAIRAVTDGASRDAPTADDVKAGREALAKSSEMLRLFDLSLKAPVD